MGNTLGNGSAWLMRLLGRDAAQPRVAADSCVFAVGDIHGRLDLLTRLTGQVISHSKVCGGSKTLIFLGDYIDRGPDSSRVVDFLLKLPELLAGWEIIFLRGNHDQALLDFLADPLFYRRWRDFGGRETLMSYGISPPLFDNEADFERCAAELREKIPQAHLKFFGRLQSFYVKGDYVFVHAGVRPGIALEDQAIEDLLWIREDFLLSNRPFEKVVVHGHTPSEQPVRRHNRIGIDTGAHVTDRLTAVVLRHDTCTFLTTEAEPRALSA